MLELDLWLAAGLDRMQGFLTPADISLWEQLLAEPDVLLLEWLHRAAEAPPSLRDLVLKLGVGAPAVLTSPELSKP